jgi:hypothetical protein
MKRKGYFRIGIFVMSVLRLAKICAITLQHSLGYADTTDPFENQKAYDGLN